MKKIVTAIAVCGALVAGTIGLTVGVASAHNTDISYDCVNVTVTFTDFGTNPPGSGVNSATAIINDVDYGPYTWTTADHTVTIPYPRYQGQGAVEISTHFVGLDGEEGNGYLYATTDKCSPEPPTTTTEPPTTTTEPPSVSPETGTRTTVAAAAAVVAAPTFTG